MSRSKHVGLRRFAPLLALAAVSCLRSGATGGPDAATATCATCAHHDAATESATDAHSGTRVDADVGPTPGSPGMAFPFPQNRKSPLCAYPSSFKNADVRAAFAKWQNDTVTSSGASGFQRVQRPADPTLAPDSTVSEGIGYGMLIAVYMNEQALFDNLWKYEQKYLDPNGLMTWYVSADGTMTLGMGAATDADEDMAWALVMADKQWGGQGSLSKPYLQIAKDQITAIWNNEVYQSKLIKPGDSFGDWNTINISYFAPAYYRVFQQLSGNDGWGDVIQTVYDTIANSLNSSNGNTANGLVPAWCNSMGQPNGSAGPTNYQYDSCRTPFRIALDYCFFGETRAQQYVAKTSAFFSGVGAPHIVDGYALDGTAMPQYQTGAISTQSAAFVGPAAVGAMPVASGNNAMQTLLDEGYADVAGLNLTIGGTYYDDSWTVLSLLMMTGNFLDYTATSPPVVMHGG